MFCLLPAAEMRGDVSIVKLDPTLPVACRVSRLPWSHVVYAIWGVFYFQAALMQVAFESFTKYGLSPILNTALW